MADDKNLSIPADSSSMKFVLGDIVSKEKLELIQKMTEVEIPREAAQQQLDSLVECNRNLKGIYNNLVGLGLAESELEKLQAEQTKVQEEMNEAAMALGKASLKAEEEHEKLAKKLSEGKKVKSPVNFKKSVIKKFPLSSDSMKLDVVYILKKGGGGGKGGKGGKEEGKEGDKGASEGGDKSASEGGDKGASEGGDKGASNEGGGGEDQSAATHAENVANHVKDVIEKNSSSEKTAKKFTDGAFKEVMAKAKSSDLIGTLVICAICHHKIGEVFGPLVLNPKKAVTAWNKTVKGAKIKTDVKSIEKELSKPEEGKDSLQIITGVTYVSSFLGLVNTIKTGTDASKLPELKAFIGGELKSACESGQIGLSPEATQKAREFLSGKEFSSSFILDSTDHTNNNSNPSDEISGVMGSMAKDVNDGEELAESVEKHYESKEGNENNAIDSGALFDDFAKFVERATNGDSGTPHNYFTRKIFRTDIVEAYQEKFYPDMRRKKISRKK